MNKPNIYLCGVDANEQGAETEAIKEMLAKLKCTVISPSEMAFSKMNWSDTLQSRIEQIKNSHIVYVLPNWRENVMNRIELTVAIDMKRQALFHPVDIKEIKRVINGSG